MQIKTTMRYQLTPVRMVIIKSLQIIKGVEKRELINCWWECKLVQQRLRTVRMMKKIHWHSNCLSCIDLVYSECFFSFFLNFWKFNYASWFFFCFVLFFFFFFFRFIIFEVFFTFHFHALEKEMATHSSVLAWRIPRMGEPGGLPSMGLHRVGHDWSDLAAAAASWVCTFMSLPNLWIFQSLFLCVLSQP